MLQNVPPDGDPRSLTLENAIVRRRGDSDWHIIFHAHGGHDALNHAFTETATRHPSLSATTIAFEEGLSVTVSRHIPGSTQPISTDRFPAAMYNSLEAEFRFEPTEAGSLLLSPAYLETVTLAMLQESFGA